jgi:hypothetical protein
MKCNLASGGTEFCFKSAFDEDLADFSPGVQLEVADMARFAVGDADWMDSCTSADNDLINKLWRSQRTVSNVVVPTGMLGVTLLRWRSLARSVRHARRPRMLAKTGGDN